MTDETNTETFQDFAARERERLSSEREMIFNQQDDLQRRLDAINREFAAIEAYEQAKSGKTAKAAVTRTTRVRKGSRREELLALISSAPAGLSRGEILERMGIKGDKSGEMSVSNALTALVKHSGIYRENGKYHAIETTLREAAE